MGQGAVGLHFVLSSHGLGLGRRHEPARWNAVVLQYLVGEHEVEPLFAARRQLDLVRMKILIVDTIADRIVVCTRVVQHCACAIDELDLQPASAPLGIAGGQLVTGEVLDPHRQRLAATDGYLGLAQLIDATVVEFDG